MNGLCQVSFAVQAEAIAKNSSLINYFYDSKFIKMVVCFEKMAPMVGLFTSISVEMELKK